MHLPDAPKKSTDQLVAEVTEVCVKLEENGEYLESLEFHLRILELCRQEYGNGSEIVEEKFLNVAHLNLFLASAHLENGSHADATKFLVAVENLTAKPLRHVATNRRRLLYRARMLSQFSVLKRASGGLPGALRYAEKASLIFLHLDSLEDIPRCLLNVSAINSALGLHKLALRYAYLALQAVRAVLRTTDTPAQTQRSEREPPTPAGTLRRVDKAVPQQTEHYSEYDRLLDKYEKNAKGGGDYHKLLLSTLEGAGYDIHTQGVAVQGKQAPRAEATASSPKGRALPHLALMYDVVKSGLKSAKAYPHLSEGERWQAGRCWDLLFSLHEEWPSERDLLATLDAEEMKRADRLWDAVQAKRKGLSILIKARGGSERNQLLPALQVEGAGALALDIVLRQVADELEAGGSPFAEHRADPGARDTSAALMQERKADTVRLRNEWCLKVSLAQEDSSQQSHFAALRVQTWVRMWSAQVRVQEKRLKQQARKRVETCDATEPRRTVEELRAVYDAPKEGTAGIPHTSSPAEETDVRPVEATHEPPKNVPPAPKLDMNAAAEPATLLAMTYHAIAVEQEHCKMHETHLDTYRLAVSTSQDHLGTEHQLTKKFRESLRHALASHKHRKTHGCQGAEETPEEHRKSTRTAACVLTRRHPVLSVSSPVTSFTQAAYGSRPVRSARPKSRDSMRRRPVSGQPATSLRAQSPKTPNRHRQTSSDDEYFSYLKQKSRERAEIEQVLGLREDSDDLPSSVVVKHNLPRVAKPRKRPIGHMVGAPVAESVHRAHTAESLHRVAATNLTKARTQRQQQVVNAHDTWIRNTLQSDVTADLSLSAADVAFLSSTYKLSLSRRPLGSRTQHHADRNDPSLVLDAMRKRMISQRAEAAAWLEQLKQQPVEGY